MRRPIEVLHGGVSAVRQGFASVSGTSERTLLLGTVLVASAVSAMTAFVLTQYYGIDVLSSLLHEPYDCMADWPTRTGRHCFSDYAMPVGIGMRPNPWDPYPVFFPPDFKPVLNNYTAAAMLPQMFFGVLGSWLGAPKLGLVGYEIVLAIAVLSPAVWAARGAQGLERIVVCLACGFAAIPAWLVLDRGNSVGLMAPIALVFLISLCRCRWGLVTVMVILASLVKPQFALIGLVLLAARQWRWGGVAVVGGVLSNLAAYVLWPRDFPQTIMQSVHNVFGYSTFRGSLTAENVSFSKGLLTIPDGIAARHAGGVVPEGFLAGPRSLLGYVILVLVVVCVMALGRRIPPAMAGIVLLATASLFLAVSYNYYLVFVLAVAALVVRDPDGPPGRGIFDRLESHNGRRRVVGICVSLAAVASIVQIALPGPPVQVQILGPTGALWAVVNLTATTSFLAPLCWLAACGAIIVSYTRRPASQSRSDHEPDEESCETGVDASSTTVLEAEPSGQRPG